MAVVKFSILTLLAGGFCTLLGIGMWMGPQEAPCNAQTDAAVVAVANSPAPIKSCWSQPSHVPFDAEFVATEAQCSDSAACSAPVCASGACEGGVCDLVASAPCDSIAPLTASAAPQPVVPRIPAATYGAYAPGGPSDSGVCAPSMSYPAGAPCLAGTACPPGAPCLPPPSFATTSYYHVAPVAGLECPPPAYPNQYGIAPAYAAPAPVVSAYASYREEPRTSDQPSMEMIEAFMEEREKRYEIQIEALEAQMELKLEAQEALFEAQHQVALTQLKAEAMVKFATMEQALREEKALLQLVADGTLTTDALRAIIAKNHANGHGSPAQPVSTAAACACEKCACETCKCGQPDAACACSKCECEGCACPGCEQAVSTAAPACGKCEGCKPCDAIADVSAECVGDDCPVCENAVSTSAPTCSACKATSCEAPVCTTDACVNREACVTACANCAKSCEACAKACDACTSEPKSVERIGVDFDFDFEGKRCTIVSDGIPMAILNDACTLSAQGLECVSASQDPDGRCTIAFGQKAAACTKDECKTGECKTDACKTVEFRIGHKSVAVESTNAPFVCEKDGCTLEVHATEVPMLSNIPYLGRLFRNVSVTEETTDEVAPADESQR